MKTNLFRKNVSTILCMILIFCMFNVTSGQTPCTTNCPPTVVVQPTGGIVCSGQPYTLTCGITSMLGFEWEASTTGCNGPFSSIGGASGPTYLYYSITYTSNPITTTTYFRCKATNQYGTTYTNCIQVVVGTNAPPTGVAASTNPVLPGQSTTLSVQGGTLVSGASWKWYTGDCGTNLVGTGSSITVSPSQTALYFVRAEGGSCTQVTPCSSIIVLVGNLITGSGTTSYLSKFSTSSSITSSVIVDNAGKIGIGTTAPLSLFHVRCNTASTATTPSALFDAGTGFSTLVSIKSGSDAQTSVLSFANTSGNNFWNINSRNSFDADNNKSLRFAYTNGTAGITAMTLLPNGNVGVQTANPMATFHVASPLNPTSTSPSALFEGSTYGALVSIKAGTDNTSSVLSFSNKSANSFWNINSRNGLDADNNKSLRFAYTNGVTGVTAMTLLPNGYVGIGNLNPTSGKLVVDNGASTMSDAISLINSIAGTGFGASRITFGRTAIPSHQQAGVFADITNSGDFSSGFLAFQTQYTGSLYERMRITNTGSVLIGSTVPITNTGNPYRLNITYNKDEMIIMDRGSSKYSFRIGSDNLLTINYTGPKYNSTVYYTDKPFLRINAPENKMELRGDIEVKADIGDWVFFDNYKLLKLEEVDAYIKKNGHLPGMLSAKEVEEKHNGQIALGDFSNRLLVKIEELTLYTIELNKQNKELINQNNELIKSKIEMEERLKNIEQKLAEK